MAEKKVPSKEGLSNVEISDAGRISTLKNHIHLFSQMIRNALPESKSAYINILESIAYDMQADIAKRYGEDAPILMVQNNDQSYYLFPGQADEIWIAGSPPSEIKQ